MKRIYLSSPHIGELEQRLVSDAFASNWIAPLGPHVDAFESEFAAAIGSQHALALSSGTAALHLALIAAGVAPGDEVLVSTFTFSASVNPITYLSAVPVLIDSESKSWNIDAALVCEELERRARTSRLPKAIIPVHLYGQTCEIDLITDAATKHGVRVIEDAAEALGADFRGRSPGTFGDSGIFSFNGNKIITTSGGGMLVSNDKAIVDYARKLSTQAREPAPHYEHTEIGYNYRLSNVLAAVGRGQLDVLEERVQARRRNFNYYYNALSELPGLKFMPEAAWGRHTRWLTTLTLDPTEFGNSREDVRLELEKNNIESRPVWKPMHLQPVFAHVPYVGASVASSLFQNGLCLPSGSNLSVEDLERVIDVILGMSGAGQ